MADYRGLLKDLIEKTKKKSLLINSVAVLRISLIAQHLVIRPKVLLAFATEQMRKP
jgi:hypothetical protein